MELPQLEIYNRQRRHRVNLSRLRSLCLTALPLCLENARTPRNDLSCIEVSLVSDRRIAQIHRDFMDIPGATDVITFPYGELVASTDTALRQGLQHGLSFEHELVLYVIHGILHLYGWLDTTATQAATMNHCQFTILKDVQSGL